MDKTFCQSIFINREIESKVIIIWNFWI